jgi:membrane-associated phospholipid phosphatase
LIGFDWFGYLRWVDQHSWLVELMRLSYGGLTGYTCLLFLLLTMTANPMERGRELILLFLASAILCSSLGALFPAIAAAAYFPIPEGSFRWIDPSAGSYHLDMLASLRSDPAHSFALNALPGLVTFPSFHTAMGVLGIYCARGVPLLLGPSVAVNTVMIASTPVFGSHYGVDVLAGAAAAGAVILVHRRLSSGALRLSLNNTCRTRPGWASSPSGEPLPT